MSNDVKSKKPSLRPKSAMRRLLETKMGACLTNLQVHFSRQTMTNEDWEEKRRLWSDIVEGIIPPDRLQDVFNRAIRNHQDSFPLTVSELIPAWDELREEERAAKTKPIINYCLTCVRAKAMNMPCPYHQRDYQTYA